MAARAAAGRTQPRSTSSWAISTAFVAAPLRRLSLTTHRASPRPSGDRRIAPHPADEDLVATRGLDRQRVDMAGGIVLDDDPGHGREQLAGTLRRDRVPGLHVDRLGVAREHGDPDRRARDPEIRQVEDLAALRDDLPLLLRVAVVEKDVDLGHGVEGDLMRVDRGRQRLAGGVGADLALELGDRVAAGPADALVRVHDDPLDPDRIADRHQHRDELHRRAVRVGDDALVERRIVGVDLADHERHAWLHPPGARVVDHRRAVGDRGRARATRRPTRRPRTARCRHRRTRPGPPRRHRGCPRRPTRSNRPSDRRPSGAARRPGSRVRAGPGSSSDRRRRWRRRPRR